MAVTKLLTQADIDAMGADFEDFEVIDGVLVERESMGERHGQIGFDLGFELGLLVKPRGLGQLYTSDTEFVLSHEPLVIVKPDIAFVRAERRTDDVRGEGRIQIAPDLAVEIVSPTNRERDVRAKIDWYRRAGVPLLWILRPRPRTVTVYATGQEPRTVGDDGELVGDDVLPGFRIGVAKIFA
jgi:Uma2 family endonuclease